jgi:hypothetical protein
MCTEGRNGGWGGGFNGLSAGMETRVAIEQNIRDYSDLLHNKDSLCGLVVRIPCYRSRDPGSIPGATQIFWEVVDLERFHSAS